MVGFTKPTGSLWKTIPATLGLLTVFELMPNAAMAAAIHHASGVHARPEQSWSSFLLANPSVWRTEHAPTFTPAIQARIWRLLKTSDPTAYPMINYLIWRRSLNPYRFDHYHPSLGPILGGLPNPPVVVPSLPQNLTPTPATPLTPPRPQTAEPSVPEPSSMLLALLMAAWGLRSRRRLKITWNSKSP